MRATSRATRAVNVFASCSGQIALLALSVLLPLAVAGGSWLDHTLRMPNGAAGLEQHYGYWAMFITTPIIIVLMRCVIVTFVSAIQESDQYCVALEPKRKGRLNAVIAETLLLLDLRRTWPILAVFGTLFTYFWVLNVRNTIDPVPTYGHDVLDALAHPYGYVAGKLYLAFVIIVVYASGGFFALMITFSMYRVLEFLRREDALSINFFHQDNCGGTSRFGNVNLLIMAMYANGFVVFAANLATHHRTYFVSMTALIVLTVLVVGQSVFAVISIPLIVAAKKREKMSEIMERLNKQTKSSLSGDEFPNLLALRNHVMGVRLFPYTGATLIAVNALRVVTPVAVTVISALKNLKPH